MNGDPNDFDTSDITRKENAMPQTTTIAGIEVTKTATEVRYEAGAMVDADGAGNCYAPYHAPLKALDNVRNAFKILDDDIDLDGNPVHGWGGGVVQDENGEAIVQQDGPYKGYLLSPTSLHDPKMPIDDYRRYVPADKIAYISIPPELLTLGVRLGDAALVADRDTGESVQAIVADVGPHRKLGEISVCCAECIGIPSSPRNGGVNKGVIVRIFLNSADNPAWDCRRTQDNVAALVDAFASES